MGHTYIINCKQQIMLRKQIISVPGYSIECPTAKYGITSVIGSKQALSEIFKAIITD